MAVQLKQHVTAEEFEDFVNRHDNAEILFELIAAEIYEVPSNPYVSYIAARIITLLGIYLLQNNLGYVTGEAGGYMVGGDGYAPDVAFISYARQPKLARKGYNPNPPELAVEVISDSSNAEEQRQLRFKLGNYLAAGVIVWVVNPDERRVEVYQPGEPALELDERGTLKAESLLPGFALKVSDIFPDDNE